MTVTEEDGRSVVKRWHECHDVILNDCGDVRRKSLLLLSSHLTVHTATVQPVVCLVYF